MKRFVLFFFFLVSFSFFTNAQKFWVGGFSNLWTDAANWLPTVVPVPTDDVVINTNTEIFLTGVVTLYEVNSLRITGGVTVTLQCTGIFREVRLTSTSAVTPALLIDVNSTLALRGIAMGPNNSSLDLTYGTGVVGSIYGTLIIKRPVGAPNIPGVRLVTSRSPTEYGIVTVYNTGRIKIDTGGSNTVSSLVPTPTLVMKDNSIYENARSGGAFPVGTWETNSLALATGTGINPPSFEGTDYGNLEWNRPAQTSAAVFNKDISFHNVNFISTNSANANGEMVINAGSAGSWIMTINGNLDVGTTARLVTTSATTPATNGGNIYVKGNINNQGTITCNGVSGTANSFLIAGTTPQTFSNTGTGTFSGAYLLFTIINPAGLTLLSPLTLPWNAEFVSGKITTTITNILTMVDNATYTGGSSVSFIEGPMRKVGNDSFYFPVGVGSIYAPIGMTNLLSGGFEQITDVFTAEYIRANPQSVYGPMVNSPLNHVSYVEYWTLQQNTGSAFKKVSLDVHLESFCKDLDNTYVGQWNGTLWTNEGSTVTNGPIIIGINETGTIRSFNNIAPLIGTAIAFTLATDLSFTDNPLPITLISFDATKLSNSKSLLNWELAACCSSAAKFEVQRAGSNRNFITVGILGGSETNRFYNYIDNALQSGINYYRLKMTDDAGIITYSRTVAVINGVDGLLLTSLIPTVVTTTASLTVTSSAAQKMDIIIVDMQGRVVQKQNYSVATGNTTIQLSIERLGAGVYQLFGISAGGKTNLMRFIKQ